MFNSKRIERLEDEILTIKKKIDARDIVLSLHKLRISNLEHNKNGYFKMGDSYPDNAIIAILGKSIQAMEDYLGVDIKWHYEDDPSCLKIETPQKRVWRAIKRKKQK